MKDFSISRDEIKFGGSLALDEHGCLYDERFRAAMASDPREQVNLPAVEAIVALRAAGRAIHLSFERWADRHQLSEGRLQLIFALKRAPEHQMPLGELADMLDVTPRNVTGLVDHLERAGLVERVHDPDDRRSVLARLTPSGLAKIKEIWQEATSERHKVTQGLTPEELVQLRHLCFRLVQNMGLGKSRVPQDVTR